MVASLSGGETVDGHADVFVASCGEGEIDFYFGGMDTGYCWGLESALAKVAPRFLVLDDMRVERGCRRSGLGESMLQGILSEARGMPVILLASKFKEPIPGFDLSAWYARHDFVTVWSMCAGAIMVHNAEAARTVLAALKTVEVTPGRPPAHVLSRMFMSGDNNFVPSARGSLA